MFITKKEGSEMDIEKVVERIESRLYEIGKTKTEFYKEVGVSSASMSQWRNRKTTPRIKVLERIADYLGVTYEWLVAGSGDKKEKPVIPEGDELLNSPVAWATAWDQASPELRRAALAVLKSGAPSSDDRE